MRKTRLTKKQSKRSRKSIKKRATTRKKGGSSLVDKFIGKFKKIKEIKEIYQGIGKLEIYYNDKNYLDKVITELDTNLITKLHTKKSEFSNKITTYVNNLCSSSNHCSDNWVNCDDDCKISSKKEVNDEIQTTLYMLNVLGNSMINGNCRLKFSGRLDKLTNDWGNDYQYFQPHEGNENSRLIMAFGPSASGKTFMVENIIKIIQEKSVIGPNFPSNFLSIDGGLHRESSYAYSVIRDAIKEKGTGFKNLVSTGIFPGIFDSGVIKKNIKNWLKTHNDKKFNIYVPETLSGCFFDCKGVYQDYINYTGDTEYIALNIWQHEQGCKCNYKTSYKCKGTMASGKAREQIEGKKYSSSAYATSFDHGQQEIKKTNGIYMDIHNPGQAGKTAIIKLYGINNSNLTIGDQRKMRTNSNFDFIILTPSSDGYIDERFYKIDKFKDDCSKGH